LKRILKKHGETFTVLTLLRLRTKALLHVDSFLQLLNSYSYNSHEEQKKTYTHCFYGTKATYLLNFKYWVGKSIVMLWLSTVCRYLWLHVLCSSIYLIYNVFMQLDNKAMKQAREVGRPN
jgi:hypothetical protein